MAAERLADDGLQRAHVPLRAPSGTPGGQRLRAALARSQAALSDAGSEALDG